ncbi:MULTISPECIES: DUF3300 domain-containing protein [Methylobacterium]|uniref:DUF3300 domain-containing protein n=1 Tax=Methylobacterium TaxID=407 RepID=UPI0013EAB951|nr:DUF3300 domain-containing protein [Methylobacterium sp. DB0501]NGM37895.1 DUF3300 domain-containing protein [Methylobacterium sp. DB0501]
MLKTVMLAAGLILGGVAAIPQGATAAPMTETAAAPDVSAVPTAWAQYGYYGRHRHWGPRHGYYGHRRHFGPRYGFGGPRHWGGRHWGHHRGWGHGPRGYYRGF